MSKTFRVSGRRPRRWRQNVYTCTDHAIITCRRETAKMCIFDRLERSIDYIVPRSGLWLRSGMAFAVDTSSVVFDRSMATVVRGGSSLVYTFPRTVKTVGPRAF